jgi:hypothetical protein
VSGATVGGVKVHTLLAIAAIGCAGAPIAAPRDETVSLTRAAPPAYEVHFDASRLDDPDSRAIEAALADDLGFEPRVIARVGAGDAQLVLYQLGGATHWLARHPERERLMRELRACEADPEQDDTHNCADTVLRDAREPMLVERLAAPCMDQEGTTPAECRELALGFLVFDVEAYCETGFWAHAQRSGSGWTVADRGRLPQACMERLLEVRAIDLDRDGAPEILLDAVYAHADYLRLVTEGYRRELSVWRAGEPETTRLVGVSLATYAGEMQGESELRCRYEVAGVDRPSLVLECCEEPVEEHDGSGRRRFPTWPPRRSCRPRWTETYPHDERAGFRLCHRVVSEDEVVVRASRADDAEEVASLRRGEHVREIDTREGWVHVAVDRIDGWIPLAATRDECAR